jgi:WD40 repeat protein
MSRFDELLNALCMEHEAALRRFGSERFQSLVNELLAMQRMIRDLEQTHQRAKCQYEEQIAKLKAQLRALNPHDKSDSVEMEPPDLTAHIEPATFTSIRSRSEDRREGSHHLQRLQPLTLPSKQGNVLVTLKRTIGTNVGVKELSFALDIPNVVCGMAFHPVHSNTIAMAAKTVCYVWDTRANGIVPLANADNASSDLYYRSVAYSPNGPFLVAGSEDHTVTLWRDGKFVRRLTGHASDVYSVKFAANGVFYSCSGDGTVRRWTINVDDLQVISDVAFQYAHGLTSLAVSPDGLSLAAVINLLDRESVDREGLTRRSWFGDWTIHPEPN